MLCSVELTFFLSRDSAESKQCFKGKDFQTILLLGDKIPQNILTEDEVLLQYYDIAQMRS